MISTTVNHCCSVPCALIVNQITPVASRALHLTSRDSSTDCGHSALDPPTMCSCVSLRYLPHHHRMSIRSLEQARIRFSARFQTRVRSYSNAALAARPVVLDTDKEEMRRKEKSDLATGAIITVLVTISTTLVSYFITERNREDTLRKSQLERVSEQLSKLYGPMFATAAANDAAWKLYFAKYIGDGQPTVASSTWSVEQKQYWAQWMELVFMKYNRRLTEVILNHTDLLVEDTMPHCLLDLLVHTDGYEVILARWKIGDFKELQSLIRYNDEILAYAKKNYATLKSEQCTLLGKMRTK